MIKTLTDLITQSQCQYEVYDLGRRIQRINHDTFASIEQGFQPYPFPIQRQAQLAIVYWNDKKQPWIWFLKFALDERGLIQATDIGNFLKYVVEAMGTRLTHTLTEEQQEQLANNPYTFKPSEEKLAVFNSRIRKALHLEESTYSAHTRDYLNGTLGWNNWQTVGLQGLSDICVEAKEDDIRLIKSSLKHLPQQPLYALLGVLEHCELPSSLSKRLYDDINAHIDSANIDLFFLTAQLRALAGGEVKHRDPLIERVLADKELCHPEMLIAIAGRVWSALAYSQVAETFLIRTAQTKQQGLFNQLFADLVMLPELRVILLPLLNSQASSELEQAILELQGAARGQ